MGHHIKRPRRIAALAVALITTAGCAHGSGGVPDGGADGGHPAPGVVTEAPSEPGAAKPSSAGHGGSASERQEGGGTAVGGAAAGGAQGAPTGEASGYGGDPVPPVKSPPVDQSVPPVHGGGVDPSGGGDGGGGDVGGSDVGGQTIGGGEQGGGTCPPSGESPSPSDSPEATSSALPSDSPSSDPSPAETCPSPSGT
ncbi:hypothetical protein BX264_1898 [Streptomyces sp. 2333.5]|uniref:hypothetical protein n=1 Tax=unclassified Streptomyces TaxID=2593676 RepID=UPI000897AEF9|nr:MULTISPECIES: hypothetical protein [unclassified Streptomyces]PJJ01588.1 hypothetical protein BX264_1898 [Streptomyces sp. 2333.5]SEC70232.1 hypothetical protein SAMN05428943_2041 [Streptomyces sp. 2314.4]SED48955.1 hypothetical protein SAMN05428942_1914 [Streptomyces sp. 2112.2]SOE14125.1 hypothetical protein SAMN06272775_5088 [Streptomyces sp. 2323.1]